MRKRWRWRRTIQSVPLLQEIVKYTVKQYLYKIRKNCILKDIYLYHHDDVLHPLLVISQCFISLVILALVGPTG
jgi:hypothetical protein